MQVATRSPPDLCLLFSGGGSSVIHTVTQSRLLPIMSRVEANSERGAASNRWLAKQTEWRCLQEVIQPWRLYHTQRRLKPNSWNCLLKTNEGVRWKGRVGGRCYLVRSGGGFRHYLQSTSLHFSVARCSLSSFLSYRNPHSCSASGSPTARLVFVGEVVFFM